MDRKLHYIHMHSGIIEHLDTRTCTHENEHSNTHMCTQTHTYTHKHTNTHTHIHFNSHSPTHNSLINILILFLVLFYIRLFENIIILNVNFILFKQYLVEQLYPNVGCWRSVTQVNTQYGRQALTKVLLSVIKIQVSYL